MSETGSTASLGKDLYEGASFLGKTTAIISLVFAILVGVCCCISGYFMIFKNDDSKWGKVIGTVSEATCDRLEVMTSGRRQTTSIRYNCDLKVKYSVNGTEYTDKRVIVEESTPYSIGSMIKLQYKLENPEEIRKESIPSTWGGIGSSVMAVLIIGIAILNWWLTSKSQLYAAASGTGTAFGAIRRLT